MKDKKEKLETAHKAYLNACQVYDAAKQEKTVCLNTLNTAQGEFDKAIDFFTRAIQKNPEYVEAWYNRGFSYEVMGNLKLARENYNRSLLIHKNYPLSIKGLNRLDTGKPFKF